MMSTRARQPYGRRVGRWRIAVSHNVRRLCIPLVCGAAALGSSLLTASALALKPITLVGCKIEYLKSATGKTTTATVCTYSNGQAVIWKHSPNPPVITSLRLTSGVSSLTAILHANSRFRLQIDREVGLKTVVFQGRKFAEPVLSRVGDIDLGKQKKGIAHIRFRLLVNGRPLTHGRLYVLSLQGVNSTGGNSNTGAPRVFRG
jgi:hypothetical protein